MATDDAERKLNQALEGIADLRKDVEKLASAEQRRNLAEIRRHKAARKKTYAFLGGIVDQLTELANDLEDNHPAKASAAALRATVLQQLADDPDVDGPDNPAPDKVPSS